MTKQTIQSILFLAVFGVLFFVVALLFKPFFSVILWSAILYTLLYPLYQKLSGEGRAKRLGRKPNNFRRSMAAGGLAIFSAVLILVPLGFIIYLLIMQTSQIIGDIFSYLAGRPDFFSTSFLAPISAKVYELSGGAVDLSSINFKAEIFALLQNNQKNLISLSTVLARNFGTFALSFAFIVFTLYFFFTDGPYLLELFVKAIPIRGDYMRFFLDRFKETTRQLIRGNVSVALIQALIAFVIFSAFRVKGALLLAALVSVCSFIPMIGAGAIWAPLSLSYIFTRSLPGGLALLVLSAVGISLLDNFYRPFLVGGPIKIHPLPIFFSIIGGLVLFGMNGIIVGPLCLALFFTALDIFRAQYAVPGEKGKAGGGAEQGEG